MSEIVANRYAQALFEVAEERDLIDTIESQLQFVAESLYEHEDLRRVLMHPQVSSNNKKELVQKLFENQAGVEVLNLLRLLIDRKREAIIDEVLEAYTHKANEKRGILDVTITTAASLSNQEQQDLAKRLGDSLGKKLSIHAKVDKSIIGGIQLRIGDRLYDGSIAGKLAGFKQEIKVGRQG
ncbi:F0F1 ATP synthase subunit delta [Sporolactobacillus terrae]|uniref:ATP synthase subunit delta n=1 Tax=Sporolactobacillus terrae TaxID=269673 RepID=A0A410DC93_9BACL|nr:F0F1 ATP synthase subunit delta [Sporolactobacillus terrae]QAA23654.1 F0F1 ATP synthase subunit delta [Sporolactobacillus terrae]QAA26624.1 F0F1 ATP synthase subunit delta [Sporolactobacillus terrae]UAK15694.1 F0F1 ATP synthase subunit delta [Sporolactobacillus terrae]BBO00178.1 F0F1 ATP synthase subunit delta [Sporolactobacillus terrae]